MMVTRFELSDMYYVTIHNEDTPLAYLSKRYMCILTTSE